MSDAKSAADRYRADRISSKEITVQEWLALGPNRRWSLIQLWTNGKTPGVTIEEIVEICTLSNTKEFRVQSEGIMKEIIALLSKYMAEEDKQKLIAALTRAGFENFMAIFKIMEA